MSEQDTKNRVDPSSQWEKVFPHAVFVPHEPKVDLYLCAVYGFATTFAIPWEYTGWRDEQMSWKETCYLHGNLNPTPTYRIKGPDALKFLSDHCVNSFASFPIGTGKHAVMCNDEGLNMMDGVVVRVDEDDFITYWMAPYISYALEVQKKDKYKAVGENLTGKVFLFQVAGPRSLEVLETVTGECLHDIQFIHHRVSTIEGRKVRILRVGMAGTLAYEIHGDIEDARPIYSAIFKAGESFGIRRLGRHTYLMNHTEAGFPQAYYHFPYPWDEDKDFGDYLDKISYSIRFRIFRGSMGSDPQLRYRNPLELGWRGLVKFDHEFPGRKALEKMAEKPRRKMVTLVWNVEDIADVYASQFRSGEHYQPMDEPNHFMIEHGERVLYADQVLKDGKLIGISSGREYSYYYREMISLASIDVEYGSIGTEVAVLWGDPGTRQKEIRATVSRFPYLDKDRNEHVDVSRITCRALKK
jgi:glycine cleavage system aminomethyltransferase T